jgi:VRR-NUC domain
MTRESTIQDAIRVALAPYAALWRNNVGVDVQRGIRYGLGVGSPDLIGIHPSGRFLGLEVKAPGGRISADQQRWHDYARSKGALVYVVRSVEEAMECLK